ncbi:MAG UNVERIFIED_CONTAM: hypothetical protein LVR18_17210 [Planctomycetaceae bacterium]
MITHRKTSDADKRRFADVWADFDSFLRQIRPWSSTTGVNSEPNGLPISDGREAVAARSCQTSRLTRNFTTPRPRGLSLRWVAE